MNRVYKVIWSKAKHCYVVTSEIARSVTKSASSARSAGRKGAAVLAMAALLFTAGGVLGEAANVTGITVNEPGNVITVTKDDGKAPDTITINNVDNAKAADYAIKATSDGKGQVIHNTYVKIANARVGADGEYVKKANTVGKNLSALDTNLSALDKQVKKNTEAVAGVIKAGEKVGETFTDLYAKVQTNAQAVAAEETARKQADQNNLKIDGDGVVSMVKDDSKPAVNKLVLNKDDPNQITLSGDGIKVGLNSGVMDKDGFYAGGDDYDHAGAALKWDGSIKGANGDFTVDTKGKVTAASGKIGTVEITSAGAVSGVTDLTVNGTFDSKTLSSTVVPDINYTTINGGKTVSMNQKNDVKTDETQASASTFDENGSNAWAKDDDSIGKSSMTADKISQSLSDTGDHPKNEASRVLSQNTDSKYEIADSVVDENGNNNVSTQTASESSSVVSGKDGKNSYNSYITQNMKKILQKIEDGDGNVLTSTEQTETGIKSTATDGENNASTNLSNEGFNTFASDGTNKTYTKQTATDIKNTAEKGMISHTAKNLVNTASENMTNTVGKDLTTTVGGNETHAVTGNQTVTVSKDRTVNVKGTETENFNAQVTNVKTDQKTSVGGNQTNIVTGNQQNTVSGSKTETVKGAVTEKYGSQATTVDKDLTTTVGGNETHAVTGNQTVTVSKDRTVNVKGTETENFNAQVTNVKTDQKTSVGGNQTNIVTGDQVNTIGGNQTITVTGDSSLSAKNITNTASEKITNQIGNGSAVKSEMTADGITNTAEDGTIYNKSKDILNEASGDIINWADGEIGNVATKITNITGKNTVISDNDGTTFENEDAKTPFVKGGEVNTKITGNKVETGKVLTDDLTVRGTSEFVGRADFRNEVYVDENLTVAKETRTDTLYVDHDGYVGGNLYVEGNIETHDAVLSADSRQVVTGRQLYQTNERVDRLDNRIKKVGANAAALAALRPGDFNPDDKFSIAAGFGSYRNANAAALGLFYRPNENVLLSLGTSFGDGENMVNAGVSVKFGRGKSMAERRKEMADEVSSMRDEMRSQDERIAELEEMLKKQSELIEKLSKES